ncbi:ADP-ribosylglycohydrolase family protein [Brevibacillus sp. NPDC058079]|uniref:ADP-ribosylglycohydrolase family protein n=1 Tax=Brevibacillus sp. NPDC058079 TaxID=3346330 RepID=UPI0036E580C1
MTGFGTHNQPVGTWSDDSSMTFCLVENLIAGYDIEDLKKLFCNWYYYGHRTHNHNLPFDIGQSTFKALSNIKAGVSKSESGLSSENSNGNGSLMRVLPLAFYLRDAEDESKFTMVEEVSGITHAHMRSKIAFALYVEIAIH